MAKGNIGNLLQHFVTLKVAEQLVSRWDHPERAIEYIDCFSMKPWEPIDKAASDFKNCLNAIVCGNDAGVVATTFRTAFADRYGGHFPLIKRGFEYPNSAMLLRYAFPNQSWNMRLHDIDQGKRKALERWLELNAGHVSGSVNASWHESPEMRREAPRDLPALVMLDPNVILVTRPVQGDPGFELSAQQVLSIAGPHRLNLVGDECTGYPAVILAFSYSEASPVATDNAMRKRFENRGFGVQRVTTHDLSRGNQVTHQGWVIHRGLTSIDAMPLQQLWDSWREDLISQK
jgi:hypothetical protein